MNEIKICSSSNHQIMYNDSNFSWYSFDSYYFYNYCNNCRYRVLISLIVKKCVGIDVYVYLPLNYLILIEHLKVSAEQAQQERLPILNLIMFVNIYKNCKSELPVQNQYRIHKVNKYLLFLPPKALSITNLISI